MIQSDSATVGAMPTGGPLRLKEELRRQRININLRYTNRTTFLRDRGVAKGSGLERIIVAMENAERDNFEPDSILAVENVYDWEHGSVADVLAGRPPRPKVPVDLRDERDPDVEREEIRRLLDRVPVALLGRIRRYIIELLGDR